MCNATIAQRQGATAAPCLVFVNVTGVYSHQFRVLLCELSNA